MDYIIRISEKQSFDLSNKYSEKYETYNCISSVLDSIESQSGGLYPVEVWTEVLRLEKLLVTANRRDKFIAEQRTRLENKYRTIIIKQDGTAIERTKPEAERSVMCVLLALAMHLEACPDDKPNPHQAIVKRIYKMVVEYDPELAITIGEAYNTGEDEENDAGYFVQPHDPLYEEEKAAVSSELQRAQERVNCIFDIYASTLIGVDNCVNQKYSVDEFFAIWDDLVKEESIVQHMLVPSKKIVPSIKEELPNADLINQNDYNLKLVLNIIGLMRDDIVTYSIDQVNALFFTDTKSKYMKPNEIKKCGTADSGIKDNAMYDLICNIIQKHRKSSR